MKSDLKETSEALEVESRVLVKIKQKKGNLLGKVCPFWKQKIYWITEKKGKDRLVYSVIEEDNLKSKVRVLNRSHLL